ncbi:MAG: PilN domain-containing protein [Acidobacteria bacterium]|nr:PilN domain-containing protein [Acidobacteriota bacterium]
MRLDINLASQPYEDSSQFWLRWGGGLAILSLFTLILLYFTFSGWSAARKDRELIRKAQSDLAARDQERRDAEALLDRAENRSTRDRSAFLNDLFQRKAFSWTRVFEDLERMMPPRLHVVSISPETTPDNALAVKLTVAGESRDPAIELVRRMEESQHFQQTQIESEMANPSPGPADAVQFNITALYSPANVPAPSRRGR